MNNLAKPICRQFDLPDVYQLGLVVPDAVAADEAMVRNWGLDPCFMLDGETALWIENGKKRGIVAPGGLHKGRQVISIATGCRWRKLQCRFTCRSQWLRPIHRAPLH